MGSFSLPRQERLRGEKRISKLFSEGRSGFVFPFRYYYLVEVCRSEACPVETEESDDCPTYSNCVGGDCSAVCCLTEESPIKCDLNEGHLTDESLELDWLSEKKSDADKASAILISVPKKLFKRAVKRNLLKRRTREAYRLNKSILCSEERLAGTTIHVAFVFASKELLEFKTIQQGMRRILTAIAAEIK